MTPEDLLYPFERQYWHDNYKDLLESRPIDPHSVIYDETQCEFNDLRVLQEKSERKSPLSVREDSPLTLENGQTIRRNPSQTTSRRVILDPNRRTPVTTNGIDTASSTASKPNFDAYTLLNAHQSNGHSTHAVLNEQSARAILAASGLLQSDEEDDLNSDAFSRSLSKRRNHPSDQQFEQSVSPSIAKRMLDAVLSGDLDVAHIHPYFSTFVDLIQSGQVELERHQAERLLHKVLVSSSASPSIGKVNIINDHKRRRSDSRSRNDHSSANHHRRANPSSMQPARNDAPSSTRRVHLIDESSISSGQRLFH